MEAVDNRSSIYELEEIFKYKNLIELTDRDVIKRIIFDKETESTVLYDEFIKLVANEVDHKLNKVEFTTLKDKLIVKMRNFLEIK
ncbi:MAG: hypothetical protein COA97_04745 [Flavobacteriales bacterium]|nr:MAG: hypothetical protein COA97_04745 [Flavobacteriales bacterium]